MYMYLHLYVHVHCTCSIVKLCICHRRTRSRTSFFCLESCVVWRSITPPSSTCPFLLRSTRNSSKSKSSLHVCRFVSRCMRSLARVCTFRLCAHILTYGIHTCGASSVARCFRPVTLDDLKELQPTVARSVHYFP